MTITSFVDRLIDGVARVEYRDLSKRIESLAKGSFERCRQAYSGPDIEHCPKCGSSDIRNSRPRQLLEAVRKQLTLTAPYRCGRCGWRGWVNDSVARGAEASARGTKVVEPTSLTWTLATASPRHDELDFDVLNIPRRYSSR